MVAFPIAMSVCVTVVIFWKALAAISINANFSFLFSILTVELWVDFLHTGGDKHIDNMLDNMLI